MTTKTNTERGDILSRYQRAEKLEQGIFTHHVAFNTTVFPHWIEDSDYFWYERETKLGQGDEAVFGKEYRLVNAQTTDNRAAFDHQALALALSVASAESVDAECLPLLDLVMKLEPVSVCFTAFGKRWRYQEDKHTCKEITEYSKAWKISPDGKKAVFSRDNNIWLRDLLSHKEQALTQDGEQFFVYGGAPTVYGRKEAFTVVDALWSSDSKRIVTQVIDTRAVNLAAPLVEHVPSDGSLRPRLIQENRRVGLPGDEVIECHQFLSIEVDSGVIQYADYQPCPVFYPPYASFFTGGRGWWDADNRHAYFIDQQLGGKTLKLIRFDSHTGTTQVLIEETSDFAVTLIPVSHINTLMLPLPETDELIWYSERSGWAHFYLYDMTTGELKHSITEGDWLVRNLIRFDADSRQLFIQTAGRVAGRNPYYCDICRVNIDTGELTTLLSTDHEYAVCDQRSRITFFCPDAVGVSPSARYVVTTRSRVDEVPVSLLLDLLKGESTTLETADISGLPENWQWPEPVMLKAADGQTDIYGVVFRPSDFSPEKSYPVIDHTYFYSAPVGSFSNSNASNLYLRAASFAELGFIIVIFNNRGNEGLRDRAFNTYQEPEFPIHPMQILKHNKADCVAGIKQLAERYPYIDIERVGAVTSTSSVPAAVAAMFIYPDFYKVGVNLNPTLDTRLFAACGTDTVAEKQLEDFAVNLRGKLLLIHGLLDDVIPVAHTLRLAEALQKANKPFDMLLLPNLAHGGTPYTVQRTWDYVVEHLLSIEPPEDFVLTMKD